MALRLLRLGFGVAFLVGALGAWRFWELNIILAVLLGICGIICIAGGLED